MFRLMHKGLVITVRFLSREFSGTKQSSGFYFYLSLAARLVTIGTEMIRDMGTSCFEWLEEFLVLCLGCDFTWKNFKKWLCNLKFSHKSMN